MKKKFWFIPLAVLLMASLVACAAPEPAPAPTPSPTTPTPAPTTPTPAPTTTPAPAPSPAEPAEAEYEWRLGMPWAQKTRNESIQLFTDLVEQYSNGRIAFEFYPDGQLGSHDEIFRAVQEGTVEAGHFAPYVDLVPGGMLNWMNWTVSNYDEAAIAYAPLDGIIWQVMDEAWKEVGGKMLWASCFGPYGLGNNVRPLKTPDDMKDIKMRVSASLGFVMTMENMGEGTGLTLQTIPWADLYNALERGVVDQCWSLWPSLIEERHYEVLTYYTDLGFGWDACNTVMNRELFDSLPSDLQDAVMNASMMAEQRDMEAQRRVTVQYKRQLADYGLEIYYPTPAEKAVWREKANMPAIWDELAKPWLDEHYPGQNMQQQILDELDRIRTLVEAAGGG